MSFKVGESNPCHKGCGDYICTVRGKYLEWLCPRCSGKVLTDLIGREPDDLDEAVKYVETLKERW